MEVMTFNSNLDPMPRLFNRINAQSPNPTEHFQGEGMLVVMASNLEQIPALEAGIHSGATVLKLDPKQDAIQQITLAIQTAKHPVKSLHLMTHGLANCLQFGETVLDLNNIKQYQPQLQQWNVPEIFLYACNLAQKDLEFIARLHQLTHASIAASSTPIGCLKQGGNWQLDVQIGAIKSDLAFTETLQKSYSGLFTIERVSLNSQGEQTNPDPQNFGSQDAVLSIDGRFIAFESNANNLVPGDSNNLTDVFIRDRQTGTTTRVSVNSFGQEGQDRSGALSDGILPALTPDGQFVAFESRAANLAPGDNNGEEWDIFVRNLQTETTTRVSLSPNQEGGDDTSRNPDISADGRFIAFESLADNLDARETEPGIWDIFVYDRDSDGNGIFDQGNGRQIPISITEIGIYGNDDSFNPSISSDGRLIVFESDANNLVEGDNNGVRDLFLHDRDPEGNGIFDEGNSSIERISLGIDGVEANGASFNPQLSGNNRFIVFESLANNLVEGDSNNALDIFVYDRETGLTTRVSVDSNGVGGNQASDQPSISDDGRFIGFSSSASNFVVGDNNESRDIFVHDRDPDQNGIFDEGNRNTTRISVSNIGEEGNADSFQAVLSGDGSVIAFESAADNLVLGDTNGVIDIFLSTIDPAITISPGIDPIEDGQTTGTFNIDLNRPPSQDLIVNFSVAGDAENNIDYIFTAGDNITNITPNSFTIAAGATNATLNVLPIFDNINESDETIQVSLQPGTGYGLTTLDTASLTIGDRSLVVTNTNDSGVGSLRQVINTANFVGGTDIITFNIPITDPGYNPNTGTFTIQPLSELPEISDVTILDATSQPGYVDRPLIEIAGNNIVGDSVGLTLTAGNSSVQGFVINRFTDGIHLLEGANNTIQGNYIGTDVAGNIDLGNTGDGILLSQGTSGNLVGGTTPETRNLISGNNNNGIELDVTTGNIIQGNYIGTNITGTTDLGNSGAGIQLFESGSNQIGGIISGAGNLISGNDTNGIELNGGLATNNLIQGNLIGTTSNGNTALGNSQSGIFLFGDANNNTIGGVPEAGNTIAFNPGDGVTIEAGQNNAILSNSIFENGLTLLDIGIDLGNDGITANDFNDTDIGANTLQNYPDLFLATITEDSITVDGIVEGDINTESPNLTIQFFANALLDPNLLDTNDRRGEIFLGETEATLNVPFQINFDVELEESQFSITATATDINNNTSEFSPPIVGNAAPVLDLDEDDSSGVSENNYSTRFREGGQAVAVADADIEIEDVDSQNLTSATLTLTNPLDGIAENLGINGILPAGITASEYDPVTGQLQLSGIASVADYQTAISQVVYNNTQLNPSTQSDRIIDISVNDGLTNSNIAETTISLIETVQVGISGDRSLIEGESDSFIITLDEAITQPLIVEFESTESTAIEGIDYNLQAGTGITEVTANNFTIAPGVTDAILNIQTIDDSISEDDETVLLNLIEGSNYLLASNSLGTFTITDNENVGVIVIPPSEPRTTEEEGEPTTYQLRLSSQPTADVTITLTSDNPNEGNPSPETITFTPADWNIPQTVTVTGVDDNINDRDVEYNIISTASSFDPNYNGATISNVTLINEDDDDSGISLTPPVEATTTEDGTPVNFGYVLESQPLADVTINLTNTNPNEGTLSTQSLIFTPTNWNLPQTVTVTGVDDNINDGDVNYTITSIASSLDADYNGFVLPDVSLTNQDNDTLGVVFTPPVERITTEDGTSISLGYVLSSQPLADVVINLENTDPSEGTLSTPALTFTPENWNLPQTVTVTGVDDNIVDGDVNYNIVTTAISEDINYNNIEIEDLIITNQDNDQVGVILTQTLETVTTEIGGSVELELILSSQPTADVVVNFNSSNPNEGIISPEAIIFTPENWNLPQTATVIGVDDSVVDGDIGYIVTSTVNSLDGNYNGFVLPDVSLTNQDNDTLGVVFTPPVERITTEDGTSISLGYVLSSQPLADVVINLENTDPSEGTLSTPALTFTPENWNLPQTVTVTGVDDNIVDGDVNYNIVTTAISEDINYNNIEIEDLIITNQDNDQVGVILTQTLETVTTEIGGSVELELILSSQPTADVVVNFNSSNPNEGIISPEAIIFTPENWNLPQTATVIGVDDSVVDGDIGYIVTSTVNSLDVNYNNFPLAEIPFVNLDNDERGVTLVPPDELVTTEEGESIDFEFILNSEPTADVTINLENTNPNEGTLSTESLIFTTENWNNPQVFTVTGVDDNIVDGNVNYNIIPTILSEDLTYNNLELGNITLTNLDNDISGILVSPTTGLTTNEAGDVATFDVVLTSQPTADVRFNLNSSNPNEGSLTISEIVFTPENWNIPQIVIVTGVDDNITDGDLSYSILTDVAVSDDPVYNGINPDDVILVNADNEIPGITVTPVEGLVTSETEGSDTFELVLNTEPIDNVTIGISSSDITEGIVSTDAVTFTPENWNIPQFVTVTGVDDNVDDGDVAYSILTSPDLLTTDPNYNQFDPSDINVTNTDNETAEILITPTTGLTTSEAGETANFDVILASQPLANVTLNLASSNPAEGVLGIETLIFTPENWEIPQTVTITGVDDPIADGDINYTIFTGEAESLDPQYNGFNPEDLTVINTDNETPGITVSPTTGLTTSEAGETASFDVVLNTQPLDNVLLNLSSDNPAEGVALIPSLIFTPDNWNLPQTVTVAGVDEFEVDGEIEYRIITEAAISNDPNYSDRNPEDVTLINLDNDLPVVDLSVDLTTAEEANTTAVTVTVTTSAIVDGEQTVNLDISGLGITPTDYALSSPQIVIPDGEDTVSVTFQVLDDVVFEGDETATLSLSNPSEGIVLGNTTANITLVDDDIPATVEFSQADYQVNEDGSIVGTAITLSRTGDTSNSTTIDVELSSETATAGIDFDNLENGIVPIRFAANQSSIVLNIPILEDNFVEDDETFSLALVNPSPGTEIGSQNTATVEILDNETPRIEISTSDLSITESGIVDSYTLVLTTIPTEPVTVQFETDSQIQPLAEISFDENNWNIPQTVEVQAVDDQLVEDRTHSSLIRHTVTSNDPNYNGFILSDVDIEISENDVVDVSIAPTNIEVSEAGDTDTYSLVLTRQPELPVTIEFGFDPQQINPISPITFDVNNWDSPQTVTVTAIDDFLAEGNGTLAISHTILSEDPNYSTLSLRNVNVEIFDNDVNAEILINTQNVSVTEAEITASYEIVLSSPPTLPVTIEFETGDRINPISSLEFNDTNWETPQTVVVVANDDNIRQGNSAEIISHRVISDDQNYADLEISDVTVNVTDNDIAAVRITQTASRTEVREDGLTDTYTVNLTSQPSDNVTVTITPDSQVDLGEGSETEIELIFTPENWNQVQTVTVTAVDDDAVEADIHTSTINHTVSSNDPDYNNQNVIQIENRTEENLTVDIVDNDEDRPPGEPGVSILQPVRRTDVIEGFGNDVYKLVLNSEPTANVEMTINSGSQLQNDQSTLTFTPTNWNIPQTVTLTAVDDNLVEDFQIVEISHSVSSEDARYNNIDVAAMEVNISDNDNIGEQMLFSSASIVSLSEADDIGAGSSLNDILFGNQGQDRLSGEEGLDLLYGQGGADGISGEVGDDVLFGGQGSDQLQGDSGNDIIYGDRGSDRLWGGDGDDQLLGGFGNDRLSGDLGADTLTGGFGNDAFVIGFGTGGNSLESADVIIDFTPTQDRIELVSPLTFPQLSIVSIPNGTAIQVQSTEEFLAVLPGIDSTLLTEQDFV
ncbi:MAG: DUF4347 domain-containing protein [Cyanobacteria bacterium J06592_8]